MGQKIDTKMKLYTFNCQGIASKERLYEFEKTWEKFDFDIVGISECRIFGEKLIEKIN